MSEYIQGSVEALERPNYSLTELEARALCTSFLEQAGSGKPEQRFGCYIIPGSDQYSDLGRYVESTVFYDTFGNRPDLMSKEYEAYDPASEFYVVVDHEEELPVGVMRVIGNSEAGLKSLEDLEKLPLGFNKGDVIQGYGLDLDRCVDVATLAVLKSHRNLEYDFIPSKLTYRTLFLKVLNNPDYDHTVAIIDKKAEKNLKLLKFPFSSMFDSGYFDYLDSEASTALIAKNSMFVPQLRFWINKLKTEHDESGMNSYIANTIESLIADAGEGVHDAMLGFKK